MEIRRSSAQGCSCSTTRPVVTPTADPEGARPVFDVLPANCRGYDHRGSHQHEGLLLLTNDGGLSRVLELPATGWLRRLPVRVHGKVEESALAACVKHCRRGVFYVQSSQLDASRAQRLG